MRGGILAAPLAAAYGAIVATRSALYGRGWIRSVRAPVPVISVGNIVAGGTGKTPMVAMTARLLRDAGMRPVVVSRGYRGRRDEDPLVVSTTDGAVHGVTSGQAGDEPVMLAGLLPGIPVVVARRRAEGASLAVTRFAAGCIVLDDGFQHLALRRDLDLVLLDAARPLDSGRLLPAGLLRERPSALMRADVVILSGSGGPLPGAAGLVRSRTRPGTPIFHLAFEPTMLVDPEGRARPVSLLAGRRVVAFAGIARPARLRASIEELGAEVVRFVAFPDHHAYGPGDTAGILEDVERHGPDLLVTTEKDLARLRGTPAGSRLRGASPVALRIEACMPAPELSSFRSILIKASGGAA